MKYYDTTKRKEIINNNLKKIDYNKYPFLSGINIVCEKVVHGYIEEFDEYKRQVILSTPDKINDKYIIKQLYNDNNEDDDENNNIYLDKSMIQYNIIGEFLFYYGHEHNYHGIVETSNSMFGIDNYYESIKFFTNICELDWSDDLDYDNTRTISDITMSTLSKSDSYNIFIEDIEDIENIEDTNDI